MADTTHIKQFDKIQILTTRNIRWVSHPHGMIPTPHGIWTIVGILKVDDGYDLLVSKRSCMCRVPLKDARLYLPEQQSGKGAKREDSPGTKE